MSYAVPEPLPMGWEVVPFNEVVHNHSGNSKLIKGKQHSSPGGETFPGFSASGQDVWLDDFEHEGTAIVLSAVGARCGKAFLAKGKWSAVANTHVLWPVQEALDPLFFWYLVNDENFWVRGGSGQPFVKVKASLERPFALPPLNEQRRIVAKIEALFSRLEEGVSALKQARARLAFYRQSLLKAAFEGRLTEAWRRENPHLIEPPETLLSRIRTEREATYRQALADWQEAVRDWEISGRLGPKPRKPIASKSAEHITSKERQRLPRIPSEWVLVRLGEVAEIGSGMSVSKGRKLVDPIEVPYLRVANVQRGHLDLGELKTMKIERSQLGQLLLRKNDVLFNEGGDRDKLGRGWIWLGGPKVCITQNHVFRASPHRRSEAWSKFISYWGNSAGQPYFEEFGKQTTNLASINKTVLSRFPVPFPSNAEVAEIVRILEERLSRADALGAEIDAALARADALRQAILKRAFSGRLVPQDPADEPATTLLARLRAEREAQPKPKRTR